MSATGGSVEINIKSGICSGLSALWLACMANNRPELFETICADIMASDPLRMQEIVSSLLIVQQATYYLDQNTQSNLDSVLNIIKPDDGFLSLQQELALVNSFDKHEIELIFQALPDKALVRIANIDHTITIVKSKNKIIIYDPNEGVEENVDELDPEAAADKLYSVFKQQTNEKLVLYIQCYKTELENLKYNFPESILNKNIDDKEAVLQMAIVANNISLVTRILNSGVNLDVTDNKNLPLQVAIGLYNHEAMQLLIANGAKLDVQTADGSTLLQTPILLNKLGYYNSLPVNLGFISLAMLLESGADPNFVNIHKYDAVTVAVHKQQWQKLALLLVYGARLEKTNIYALKKYNLNTANNWRLYLDVVRIANCLGKKPPLTNELLQLCNYTFDLDQSKDLITDLEEFLQCINCLRAKHIIKDQDINIKIAGIQYKGITAITQINDLIINRLHQQQINAADAWQLYALLRPWTGWFAKSKIVDELLALFTMAKEKILNINNLGNDLKTPGQVLGIIEALQHFAELYPTSINNIKLRAAAQKVLQEIQQHVAKIMQIPAKQVITGLRNISWQHAAVIKQQRLEFLGPNHLALEDYPQVSKILASLAVRA